MLSYNMPHNFSTLLNTLRGKIWTLEAWTAVYMVLCIMRDKTCLTPNCLPFQFYANIKIHPWNKAKESPASIQYRFPQRKQQQCSVSFLGRQDLPRFLITTLIQAMWQQWFSKTVRNMKFIPTCDCSSSSSSSGSAGDGSVAVISSSQLSVSPSSPRTSCNSA